jgi:formylglycine-generating enzyme required for sulfatase activity
VDRFDDEGPQTTVTLTQGFYIGKYEVTQREYEVVMGINPSYFNGDRTSQGGGNYGTDLSRPVESVSWDDAVAYCAALTARERTSGAIPAGYAYQLPTEAQWEYACRAGTTTRFSYGDDPHYTNLSSYEWYFDNSSFMMQPVGQKLPNPWGLYDMQGNANEWCRDWYGIYPGGSLLDPQGPASGLKRVSRGGFSRDFAKYCRAAWRDSDPPQQHSWNTGFRVVLAPGQPQPSR